MIEKIECTCIEAYTTRKMRDPNCCACSCDHNDLVGLLAKANERVKELEKELKESDEDLGVTQQQSSQYENALEEVQAVFVDSDACPLFEPFNANNLSNWLNKFAIENQIKALVWFDANNLMEDETNMLLLERIEQLRKEQGQ